MQSVKKREENRFQHLKIVNQACWEAAGDSGFEIVVEEKKVTDSFHESKIISKKNWRNFDINLMLSLLVRKLYLYTMQRLHFKF